MGSGMEKYTRLKPSAPGSSVETSVEQRCVDTLLMTSSTDSEDAVITIGIPGSQSYSPRFSHPSCDPRRSLTCSDVDYVDT